MQQTRLATVQGQTQTRLQLQLLWSARMWLPLVARVVAGSAAVVLAVI
jgi:hypothetical protein